MRGPGSWCETCHNTGDIDCHCGGDLCVCGGGNGDGTDPCPDCHGEPGHDGDFDDCFGEPA
ncbi:hypothetical protein [Sphingomonas profundi]|uniref:hypothetical protein n=1 Tax=Alterirhizorhabdus profundi TaxID=2681549 RepID=UPI0012E85A0C|nr:hypothetical protein [Sphingomonas profundi]